MLNINHLPVDCLLLIFSKFSLQEQITGLRVVCQHWKTTVEAVLCRKRHSLKLFGRLKNITDHCLTTLVENTFSDQLYKLSSEIGNFDDDLIIDSYIYCDDLEMYDFLGRLFGASVTTLSVHLCWDAPFSGLPIFLQAIHQQLTTLTISGAIDYPHGAFTTSLCQTIEKLQLLARLDLLVIDLFLLDSKKSTNSSEAAATDIPATSTEIELPVTLARLEHFALCNYKGDLVDVLLQLTPTRCHSLRLDLPRDYDPVELLEDLVEECPELLENLHHFRFSLPDLKDVNEIVRLISGTCKHLQSLDLQCCSFVNFEMVKLNSTSLNQLNCLEHLSELRLSHVGVNLADCFTQKAAHYLFPQMAKLKTLYLSQVAPWPRTSVSESSEFVSSESTESSSKNSSSLYIESSTEGKCWQAVASIFPRLTSLNVRVKQSSVPVISNLLNGFYDPKLTKISVYSAAEQCTEYFGHRKRYQVNSRTKGGIFFSECFFERVNQL